MATSLPSLTREQVAALFKKQEEREAQERERIRQAMASSKVPVPEELAQAVIKLNSQYASAILRHHAGYPLAERRDSYLISLAIMEQCLQDLLVAIDVFESAVLSKESGYFRPGGEDQSGRTERRIQKELFATANAAASLVDHGRRLHKVQPIPGYDSKRVECFGTDGLHEFVIGLRVILHHLHAVEPGWLIEGSSNATFVIGNDMLRRIVGSYSKGLTGLPAIQAYIEASPEHVDLRKVFLDYRARMAAFNGWVKRQLEAETFIALHDYDTLNKRKGIADERMFWKAMTGNWLLNWKVPPDPHVHLPKYLTQAQLDEVYKLPRNSKKQVDLVISYMDKGGAVDDALRADAYELFARSPPAQPERPRASDAD
ncbi:hypothetical protein LB561_23090 [Mesorhizobium sp. B292B1B]|uniref:hypothetical protein n=1 Tax=unclassified Mesorhizobium TaxID=325217 RepID=UPI00112D0120|nr:MULTISPECIES: hypothetical protein [unclassified Mesorhizobium]MCA0013173.1 hypothetical protein [Mesorhizobium sp. B294B1A1]MCA0040169.1 hypothetical protein [Mesorhizobium sp. B292B1B]TPM45240.1 hypothetical protein FJ964_17430 [Mesorhizobium sp. B2-3-2]